MPMIHRTWELSCRRTSFANGRMRAIMPGMSVIPRVAWLAPMLLTTLVGRAAADPQQCVDVQVDFTPSDSLQIAAWVEDSAGNYVDTLYLTQKVGVYGLGNRPGRFDFNSGPVPIPTKHVDDMWPYGRRITALPVWAHH